MSNQFHLSYVVKGNALAPRLRDGERVIVDTRLEPQEDDDVVLIAQDGSTNVFGLEGIGKGCAYFQCVQNQEPYNAFNLKLKDIKAMYVVVAIQCKRGGSHE